MMKIFGFKRVLYVYVERIGNFVQVQLGGIVYTYQIIESLKERVQ